MTRFETGRFGALPGFRVTLAATLIVLALIVVMPLTGLLSRAALVGPGAAWAILTEPRTLAAFQVSFGVAALAVLVDIPIGLLLAWVLVRYRMPGRRVLDAMIDLPFALPTAVAGITLATLYADTGLLGAPLAALGLPVAYTPLGIGVALLFIGLPFIVRTVQPVLADLDRSSEEAAMTLDASPWMIVRRVILPPLWPALCTGAGLAFARAVGEYGSVIFIAGNRPGVSEIVPLLIVAKLEQFDYPGAALLGTAMLLLSFALLLAIGGLSSRGGSFWSRSSRGRHATA